MAWGRVSADSDQRVEREGPQHHVDDGADERTDGVAQAADDGLIKLSTGTFNPA